MASVAGTKPSWMKPSGSWNIFTSPRWIRIALTTVVVVSTCVFLALETRAFDNVSMPAFSNHKGVAPGITLPESAIVQPELVQPESPKPESPKPESPKPEGPKPESPKPNNLPPLPTPPPYLEATTSTTGVDKVEKLAYVTFLSETVDTGDDLEEDKYFQAVRILLWQLIHKPETRTKHDVIVMVTPTVSQARRDRLKKDGAIVHAVEFLHTENDSWIHAEKHRWDDVMTKMRVWEITQYDRILMLDGDSMLLKSLDSVFDDPGAKLLATKPSDESGLPSTYLLASNSEVWDSRHSFPPTHGTGLKGPGYMNAGFFILAPSLPAFEYYKSLINTPNSFDPKYPEQNLINYAHRWDGPMPWRELAYTWNIRCPNDVDIEKGLVSVHEKWWTQPYIHDNKKTKQWLFTRRWEMKGWYDALEESKQKPA